MECAIVGCRRGPDGTAGGHDGNQVEGFTITMGDEGVMVGVGVIVGFVDEESLFHGIIQEGERVHDGNEEVPDVGIGVGLTHDGTCGVGVGVG